MIICPHFATNRSGMYAWEFGLIPFSTTARLFILVDKIWIKVVFVTLYLWNGSFDVEKLDETSRLMHFFEHYDVSFFSDILGKTSIECNFLTSLSDFKCLSRCLTVAFRKAVCITGCLMDLFALFIDSTSCKVDLPYKILLRRVNCSSWLTKDM